jgi:hypothetical protein
MSEGLLLLAALAAIAGIAALPLGVTRGLGAAGLGAVVYVFARHPLGDVAAALLAAVLGLVAHRLAPPRVLRRIAFLVPSFALLVA